MATLVTGGTGFVGANIVKELARRGSVGRIELVEEKEAHRLCEGTRIGLHL